MKAPLLNLSPSQAMHPPPPYYEVLKFATYGPDGNANFQPVAVAPSFDLARDAVAHLQLTNYAIRVVLILEAYVPAAPVAPPPKLDG